MGCLAYYLFGCLFGWGTVISEAMCLSKAAGAQAYSLSLRSARSSDEFDPLAL